MRERGAGRSFRVVLPGGSLGDELAHRLRARLDLEGLEALHEVKSRLKRTGLVGEAVMGVLGDGILLGAETLGVRGWALLLAAEPGRRLTVLGLERAADLRRPLESVARRAFGLPHASLEWI